MSASLCIAYVGLRFEVDEDELEALEERTDPRQVTARTAGLTHYWGNFGGTNPRHVLLVGKQVAVLGPENSPRVSIDAGALSAMIAETQTKLSTIGLVDPVALHIEWLEDD